MAPGQTESNDRGRMKVALSEDFGGIRNLDLYVDYLQPQSRLDVIPHAGYTFSDYLRKVLAPVACPRCQSKNMNLSMAGGLKHGILKVTGRRMFFCSQCSAQQIVKVHHWQWEIAGTVLAVVAVLSLFSCHWLFR
jgi:hypothetical protein